ncbi:DNA helicase B isoform X1 [Mirounga angustirostris]|uniref:DNA helicase B isoform X1 n=3 Tax=Mirounga angustirostris TaxID=9716 RepID=UPI001E68D523|nr:DNA helicase B [Mirounga angustirostris]XP_045728979.1 DNA helicase B [Mirounga angustirostris]
MAFLSQHLRELQGPLLPPKDLVEEDDDCLKEDVEEDEDLEFVDAEELCSGGVKAGTLPGRLRVVISDENTQEQCDVFGRFPVTGPWWRVKVQVKPMGSRSYQVQGFPSYFLQSDMSPPNQKHICSLFLKDCNFPSDYINKFLAWVNAVSSFKNLNFENLRETLRTFQKETGRNGQKKSTQNEQEESLPENEMWLPVENTIPFKSIMTALQFPKVMEFLPVLLPRHFKRLLSSGSKEVLEDLEEMLGTHPWKLGFSKITYTELKLLQCEASWTSFCQCKSLLQLMSDLEKNALIIYSKLRHICRDQGHTCIEEADLTSKLSDHMSFQDAWRSLKFLKDIGVVTYEKGCVFLYDLYQAERGIASSICDLMTRPPWHLHVDVKRVLALIHTTKPEKSGSDETLNESQPDETGLENPVDVLDSQDSGDHVCSNGKSEVNVETSEGQLDQDQVAALEMVCSNAVTVISGKGGCGKTTIVSHLFKHMEQLEEREVKKACEDFEQDQDVSEEWITFTEQSLLKADKAIEVLLTAPTGKAAGLLREKTGFNAYTLCQVNYSFYLWEKKSLAKNHPWKFSSVRVLVVDEGSLVSVRIFKSVLKLLCEHSKLSKLIILGDIRQLPSIEPGNLLIDLFETLKSRNCAIELKKNHRAESELIVNNATRISRRQFPIFDAELNISDNPTLPASIQDKTFIFIRLPEEDASSQLSKNDPHSYLYSAVRALLKENDLQDAQTSQFIAFRRQDCDVINACCCKHYTGHLIKDHRNRLQFGVGDKICCTRNAYLSELLPESTSPSQESNEREASGEDFSGTPHGFAKNKHDFESDIRLCNGEIFFITKDVTDVTFGKRRSLTINNAAGLEITVDFEKLMKYCHIKHAWARTIHTFQGSEEKTVVYMVGKAGRQHWQHVYTAVTRGRCRVYVIAEESHLRSAIMRNGVLRRTRLKHFLQNKLSTSCASPADFASLSRSSGESRGLSAQASASSVPPVTTTNVTAGVPGSRASAADDRTFAFPEGRKLPSSDEVDPEEDPSELRGSKRACGLSGVESPSKIRMVEESSPQVSSRLQNLRLNRLTPRQLFISTNNQET